MAAVPRAGGVLPMSLSCIDAKRHSSPPFFPCGQICCSSKRKASLLDARGRPRSLKPKRSTPSTATNQDAPEPAQANKTATPSSSQHSGKAEQLSTNHVSPDSSNGHPQTTALATHDPNRNAPPDETLERIRFAPCFSFLCV